MSSHVASLALVLVVAGVGAVAFFRVGHASSGEAEKAAKVAEPSATAMPEEPNDDLGTARFLGAPLPPGHPAIAGNPSPLGEMPSQDADPPAITWKAPGTWLNAANPTSMRLATYRVPRASADAEDADVSVTRAGGTTQANIERWLGQFEHTGTVKRVEKTVHGLKLTVVEVSGTFLGTGMSPGAATQKPGWTLLGAIVETPGSPYFIKLTGPAATVRSARTSFYAMLDGITPT
jgi:hypothetical protein